MHPNKRRKSAMNIKVLGVILEYKYNPSIEDRKKGKCGREEMTLEKHLWETRY